MAQEHNETHHEERYADKQETETGENREEDRKQTEDSHGKGKVDEGAHRDVEAQPPPSRGPGGRTYYFTVPIRPLSGHIPDEFLQRVTMYYALYGLVFGAVGAIAIVLPLVFGVGVASLLPWLLVLGGSVTLLVFLLICGAPGTTSFLLLSALHLTAGIYLLVDQSTTNKFIYLLTGWFLLHGVVKAIMSVSIRRITTWPVVLVSGIASGVLALVILVLTPQFGFDLVTIAFGADLAFTGVALLLVSVMGFLANRSVTDADLLNEPFLQGNGQGEGSA